MKKNAFMAAGMVCAVLAVIFAAPGVRSACAEECRIVKIQPVSGAAGASAVRLDPAALSVKKGTCVIWVNWVKGARVAFKEDSKRCEDASGSAAGFITADNCYLTDFLEYGGTSSLLFNQSGTFSYSIELPDARQAATPEKPGPCLIAAQGRIIVEE